MFLEVPSLLRLAGAKPPARVSYDGEDLLDTLLGKSEKSREAPIFFGRPPDRKKFYGFEDLPDARKSIEHVNVNTSCPMTRSAGGSSSKDPR